MLAAQITSDMTTALKAGETDRVRVLRLVMTSLKNEQIKLGHELSDNEAMTVLSRETKQRRDSIAAYEAAKRNDLAKTEQAELDIIAAYLPKQLSEAEISQLVDEALKAAGEGAQIGAIIGAVKTKAGASADGAVVARVVRERLG